MRTSLRERQKQYRRVYEELNKNPRIFIKELSEKLGMNRHAAGRRLREAFEKGYILAPQLRKRSYSNMKEYMYFINCDSPLHAYKQYSENTAVVYHARMSGFANLWVISIDEIDIEGEIIAEGYRSDYHVAYAPNHSWDAAIYNMHQKIETFNPKDYQTNRIIQTHWDEFVDWDPEFEILCREFKYNMRKTFTPIMGKHHISAAKIYKFLEKLPEYCTVFTRYFPKTISAYDPYLFLVETEYEDFVIDLFSELPTSSFFFKVANKLFAYTSVERAFLRNIDLSMPDVSQLQIPLVVDNLLSRGILKSEAHAILEFHCRKEL